MYITVCEYCGNEYESYHEHCPRCTFHWENCEDDKCTQPICVERREEEERAREEYYKSLEDVL